MCQVKFILQWQTICLGKCATGPTIVGAGKMNPSRWSLVKQLNWQNVTSIRNWQVWHLALTINYHRAVASMSAQQIMEVVNRSHFQKISLRSTIFDDVFRTTLWSISQANDMVNWTFRYAWTLPKAITATVVLVFSCMTERSAEVSKKYKKSSPGKMSK